MSLSPVFAVNALRVSSAFSNIIPANMGHTESCVNRNLFLIGCKPAQQCTDATSLFLVSCLLCPVRQDILSKTKSLALSFSCKTQTLWNSLCVSKFTILVYKKYHVQWAIRDRNTVVFCLIFWDSSLLCAAVMNNDVQGRFVCLLPFRMQQKTQASALKSGFQLVGNSSGSWFPYNYDERDCIKTGYNLFKDRHLPVCGQKSP